MGYLEIEKITFETGSSGDVLATLKCVRGGDFWWDRGSEPRMGFSFKLFDEHLFYVTGIEVSENRTEFTLSESVNNEYDRIQTFYDSVSGSDNSLDSWIGEKIY